METLEKVLLAVGVICLVAAIITRSAGFAGAAIVATAVAVGLNIAQWRK